MGLGRAEEEEEERPEAEGRRCHREYHRDKEGTFVVEMDEF
jgi:hypothetical protein